MPYPATRSRSTLAVLRDAVLGDLGLRNSNRITSTDVDRWLNDAQEIVADETSWLALTLTFSTTGSTAEYVIPTADSFRCKQIEWVRYADQTLVRVPFDGLYKVTPDFREDGTGTPTAYYVRGGNAIGLLPIPATGGTVSCEVIALPPDVSDEDTYLYVPHGYQDLLVIYAKLKASEADISGEPGKRIPLLQQQWERRLAQCKESVRGTDAHDVTVMGIDASYGHHTPLFNDPSALVGND